MKQIANKVPHNRILIVTNAYPSNEKPFAGIFVKNQVQELECRGNYLLDTFVMHRSFTGLAGSVIKYIRTFIRFIPLLFRRFDLIHLHFFFPLIWAVVMYKLCWPKTSVVVTFHGSDIHLRFRHTYINILHKYALSKVDFIHCVGYELADEVKDTLGRNANVIMPVGIDKRIFKVDNSISLEKKYDFIFVGSFTKRKGVDLVLEAISMLTRKELRFCFIGSGPEEHIIRQYVTSHNITILKNLSQNEISKSICKSRFFILPSRYEPFGLVVTEALYCGVPCIVSQVGGLKEQIEDSVNGLFIDSLDATSVALAMKRALIMKDFEYSRMSRNAENSNEDFSLESVVKRMEDIYGTLIVRGKK